MKASQCQRTCPPMQQQEAKRHRFDLQVGKIPWRRAWQHTALFLPGESSWTGREPGGVCMGWQSRTLLKQFIMHIYMFIEKAIYYNNFLSKSHKGFFLKTSIQTQTQMILDTLLDIRNIFFPIFLYRKVPLSRKLLRLRMINQ